MKVSRILGLIITFSLVYWMFCYDAPLNEKKINKPLSVRVVNDEVDINVNDKVHLHNSANNDQVKIDIDKITVVNEGNSTQSKEEISSDLDSDNEPVTISEVSMSDQNPMILRAGNEVIDEDKILVAGVGIGEIYELDGHDITIEGVKNQVVLRGKAKNININGVGLSVTIQEAESISVNGVGNRVYVKDKATKKKVDKNGVINTVWIRN